MLKVFSEKCVSVLSVVLWTSVQEQDNLVFTIMDVVTLIQH